MSKLTTGLSPLTVEARDYDSVTLPVDAFEFSPSEKYVGLKTGWGFRTSLLTLSGAGSPLYSPVTGEKAIGTYHPLNRTVSAFDLAVRTDLYSSPYSWDLSSLIPVGTKAVLLHLGLFIYTASQHDFYDLLASDYDLGTGLASVEVVNKGMRLRLPGGAASSGAITRFVESQGCVLIGSSRKLYIGLASSGPAYNALIKGYWI